MRPLPKRCSAHLQAIYQRFSDTAYRDVDTATTEAVARGWVDPTRLAIFGWSVEGAGITDWLSFIMTSDLQQTDYGARELSAGAEPFLKYSAVMFTKNVTTTLLILHGESDVRSLRIRAVNFSCSSKRKERRFEW